MDIGIIQIAMVILVIVTVQVGMKLLLMPAELHQAIRQLEPLIRRLNEEVPDWLQEASQAVQNINRVTADVGFVMPKVREVDHTFDAVKQDVSRFHRLARWFMRISKYPMVMKVRDWLNRLLRSPSGFNGKRGSHIERDGSHKLTNKRRKERHHETVSVEHGHRTGVCVAIGWMPDDALAYRRCADHCRH